jgi:hypothetical protein
MIEKIKDLTEKVKTSGKSLNIWQPMFKDLSNKTSSDRES